MRRRRVVALLLPCRRANSECSMTRTWPMPSPNRISSAARTASGTGTERPNFIEASMIYTIGHSKHPIERFVALLQQHGIDALADVRSTPYSRFNPQFNREKLQASLAAAGIRYVFLGEELGARSKDASCYDEEGRVSYAKLAQTAPFRAGIERLLTGMQPAGVPEHRIA